MAETPDPLFIAAVVKGLVEQNNLGAFFGSYAGLTYWTAEATKLKLVTMTMPKRGSMRPTATLTQQGLDWYIDQALYLYTETRAYFWVASPCFQALGITLPENAP